MPTPTPLQEAEAREDAIAEREAREWLENQETRDLVKPCKGGCGATVTVPIPVDYPTKARETMEKMPVLCEACAAKEDARAEELEAARRREAYLDRVKSSQIDRELIGLTFDNMRDVEQQRDVIPDVERWANREVQGLILSGEVGVGKSYLAAIGANRRLLVEPLDWVRASKLMVQARAGFQNPARDQVTKLLLNGRKTLVLDDIDKAKATEFVLEILFEAIDSRITNGAGLLVTTNLGYEDFAEHVGEALASRIVGYCVGHRLEGIDLRTGMQKRPGDGDEGDDDK